MGGHKNISEDDTLHPSVKLRECYGAAGDGWLNKIFWGDNLQVMEHLMGDFSGRVDLVYIDPPFDSNTDYKKTIRIRGKTVSSDDREFQEKQYGDTWADGEYLQFMSDRLTLIRGLLSDKGTVYVHCDHREVFRLKLLCDSIFGSENFMNMITWRRQIVRGMKVYAKYYSFSSDYILIYAKKKKSAIWNRQTKINRLTLEEAEAKYMKDENGFFRTSDPGSYSFDSLVELHGKGLLYAPNKGEVLIDADNRTVRASNGGKVAVKYYRKQEGSHVLEEVTIDNIWDDIPGMGVVSSEFLGYPTQKPEALLERIIRASTNRDSIVFDCFMGSGTTQAVAMKLGRRFIGADINLGAVQTATKRLISTGDELNSTLGGAGSYTGFEVYSVNDNDFFRSPIEARELMISALNIEKLSGSSVYDGELDGRMVKLMPANRAAVSSDLDELIAALPYSEFEQRKAASPSEPVERITLVCMGHEPDLKEALEAAASGYKLDIEIVDLLSDDAAQRMKRSAQAAVVCEGDKLIIKEFFPLHLMQKLGLTKRDIDNWRQLVESVMIDFNYDGAVFRPTVTDIPQKKELVIGEYHIPDNAGVVRVKITDLLSESLEIDVT